MTGLGKPLLVIVMLGLAAPAFAQTPAVPQDTEAGGDWATYGHDKGGQRHSPLVEITPDNVARLTPAWTYHMRPMAEGEGVAEDPAAAVQRAAEGVQPVARPGYYFGSQVTPLVVGGRMFVTTPYGRATALDPQTGAELWSTVIPGPGVPSMRGVEYWAGDGTLPPRILFGTRDGRLIALDAATGSYVEGFGEHGVVNLKTPEVMNGTQTDFYGMTSPPIVFGNLVITGSAVQEFPPQGVAGDVRAWDVRTGALVWTFHSVPRDGEPGAETWADGSRQARSGVNAWGFLTVDEERGVVYMPFGAPAFDRYGGDRAGDNLYGTSLVAADARTGRYLWHFQVVHHDIWDNDLQAPPLLFDFPLADGSSRPAVAVVSKNSLLFVLDRETGAPLLPVEERPFPASNVPGEQASPTQPIPVITPPLARTTFSREEVADLTPEMRERCLAYMDSNAMVAGGLYVPVGFQQPTISFPGLQGGANWGGASFDPATGLLIVNTNDLGQVTELVPATRGPLPYDRGRVGGRFQLAGTNWLCQQPPWGRLSAVDVASGRIAWQVRLGVTDSLPEGLRETGRPNVGGSITTASGLTFIGATDDGRFRAFETATGRVLWETRLPASAHATPITYRGDGGRQFVAVTATGGSFLNSPLSADTIVAFALPEGE
jgi:quinoprotein glucose dehydrogenase